MITLSRFKQIVREQSVLLYHDQEHALATLYRLLPADAAERLNALKIIQAAVEAPGDITDEIARRLGRVAAIFEARTPTPLYGGTTGRGSPRVAMAATQSLGSGSGT